MKLEKCEKVLETRRQAMNAWSACAEEMAAIGKPRGDGACSKANAPTPFNRALPSAEEGLRANRGSAAPPPRAAPGTVVNDDQR